MSSTTAWLNDDLTTADQSVATLQASNQLDNGFPDVEVPSIRPRTTQCDPWCSAAMHRQVQSSNMLSWDHALAKCGVILLGVEN